MSRYVDLTRRLLASGDATPEDGQGALLFYELENSLIVKQWTGEEFGDTTFVASEVRDKTPASCLIWPGQVSLATIFFGSVPRALTSTCHQNSNWFSASANPTSSSAMHIILRRKNGRKPT